MRSANCCLVDELTYARKYQSKHAQAQTAIRSTSAMDLAALITCIRGEQELGRLAVHLPVDLPLVKLILVGRACGCVNEAVVMAASLSMEDVFAMPHVVIMRNQTDFVSELSMNFASRLRFDAGRYSEPLMYLSCYGAYLASNRTQNWARRNSVSLSRMNQLNALVANLAAKLRSVLSSPATHNGASARGEEADFASTHTSHAFADPMLANLERLQVASRSRGGAHVEEVNAILLQAHQEDVLRFVIAAACAPTFLHGTAKRASNFPPEEECDKLRLALNRTVLMTGVPRSIQRHHDFVRALESVRIKANAVRFLSRDKCVVELADFWGEGDRATVCARTSPKDAF